MTRCTWGTANTSPPLALVDVRSMFVSVERVLDPTLRDRAVIVLSHNDGCAVARSDEAKALGVQMGDPWFQLRDKPHLTALVAESSNYEEYGAFSSRFHETVATISATTETYSVDEAFVGLPRADPAVAAETLQARVRQWTGLPTAAGIGPTKVLALRCSASWQRMRHFFCPTAVPRRVRTQPSPRAQIERSESHGGAARFQNLRRGRRLPPQPPRPGASAPLHHLAHPALSPAREM